MKRYAVHLLAALLLTPGYLAATPKPAAADPPPAWQGVWVGTIGSLSVRACFAREDDAYSVGAYYYLSRLRPIQLNQQDTSKVWLEGSSAPAGKTQPRWTFDAVGAALLTGIWTDGQRTLPFRLTRLPSAADEGPCGSAAFNAPRWRPLQVKASVKHQDGFAYRALSYTAGLAFPDLGLDGFELPGDDTATKRINVALRAHVPGKEEEWRGCMTSGLDAHGLDGDYQVSLSPTLITVRWLAVELDEEEDCGGPHPNNTVTPLTFDRGTGIALSLDTWLTAAALARDPTNKDLPPAVRPVFRRFLLAQLGEIDADCREALDGADYWDIGLDRKGLNFTPELSHAEQACADPVLVPWKTLTPWLSSAGRSGRDSIAS